MTQDSLGINKPDPQSEQDLHIAHVYEDPDFTEAVLQLCPQLTKLGIEDRLKYISEIPRNDIVAVAKQNAITVEDVLFYMCGNGNQGAFYRGDDQLFKLSRIDDTNISVSFDLSVTYDDFLLLWKKIVEIKRQKGINTKNKPYLHHKLVYAIFKQRQATPPTPFSKIHTMYLTDTLPGYIHERADDDRIYDAKKFEDYYRKHKPNPIPPA